MPFGPFADAHHGHTPSDPERGKDRIKNWPKNEPHRHAFVMLGDTTLFVCHLTQHWYEEHRYQLIIEAELPSDKMRDYRALRTRFPKDSFFLANRGDDAFTLPSLQAGDRKEIRCEIFRGIPATDKPRYTAWPWDKVTPVIPDITVGIKRIVHYRPFCEKMNYPTTLIYLLFGAGTEAHMANWQTKEPDFDHVLSLREAPSWLPQDQLKAGVIVDIPGQEGAGSQWPQALCGNHWPEGADRYVRYRGEENELAVKIGRTSWFSLKIANSSNPCATGGEQWPPGPGGEAAPAGEGGVSAHV
jgi:hypothetical protein